MSLLDRIAECNRHNPARYVPLRIGDVAVGHVRRDRLEALAAVSDFAVVPDVEVCLAPHLANVASRTAALNRAVRAMAARGACEAWRGEPYAVGARFGHAVCEVDRAGAELLGITAYGVHLNGYVDGEAGLSLWVPRRAAGVRVCPGRFDNTVAGGLPAGMSVAENLAKECGEEAGLPAELAAKAVPAGTVAYTLDGRFGLKRGVLFVFDLPIPDGIVPVNRDGEVERFALWPAGKVLDRLAETRDFKFDSALVAIDFFVRRGLLRPDHPDYVAMCTGLRN